MDARVKAYHSFYSFFVIMNGFMNGNARIYVHALAFPYLMSLFHCDQ